jgi:hypothetical protein
MNAIRLCALLAATTLVPTAVNAQAFGIEMGQKANTLRVQTIVDQFYVSVLPPKPHPEFSRYFVSLSQPTGVCSVEGVGRLHHNDRYGSNVRTAYNSVRNLLWKLYGPAIQIDKLKSGALWAGENEWVMSVAQNEREFSTVWGVATRSKIPANIEHIVLTVKASSSSTSQVRLWYQFKNHDTCLAEKDRVRASGL